MWRYIAGSVIVLIPTVYILLYFVTTIFPYKCKFHGWNKGAIWDKGVICWSCKDRFIKEMETIRATK